MSRLKALGGLALLAIVVTVVVTVLTLAGIGVDDQLLGSDWQIAGLVTGLFILLAVAGLSALGKPWQTDRTTYW